MWCDTPVETPTVGSSPDTAYRLQDVSKQLGDYIARLSRVWVEGQLVSPKPYGRLVYVTLRDPDVDMSMTMVVPIDVWGSIADSVSDGARVVALVTPEWWAKKGDLRLRAHSIRAVGVGDLLVALQTGTDADLAGYLTYRLHLLNKLTDLESQRRYPLETGLSLSEGRSLSAIGAFAPLSVNALARMANLDKGQASRAAQSLVDQGLVAKAPSPSDARGVVLTLTPRGRKAWARAHSAVKWFTESGRWASRSPLYMGSGARSMKRKARLSGAMRMMASAASVEA